MENKDNILSEIQKISTVVADIGRINTYTVPNSYFDRLPTEILSNAQTQSLLGDLKNTLYTAPNGYFNGLAENILLKAKANERTVNEIAIELEGIAPLLNNISKKPSYYLPDGYFEEFAIQPQQKEKAKVVTINKWKKISKYAVAAAFVGVLATAGVKYFAKETNNNFEEAMANASDEELRQMLESHTSASYSVINAAAEGQQTESSLFEGTSEEELKQFLKEQPETVEKLNKDI